MKNQYFGDNRDLFKYGLIYQIMDDGLVNHFTFIPMLTENDGKGDGEKDKRDKKPGTRNRELVNFLDECREAGKRNIEQLESFFKEKSLAITLYGKDKFFPYEAEQRKEYFKQIEDKLLSESLIFVDPDNGMQVRRSRKEHILYSEVKNLYERMDEGSILMIYQHFPRNEKHTKYLDRRSEELKAKVAEDSPIYISDNEIIFFLLTKGKSLRESLAKTISTYKEKYESKLYVGGIS